eukprot:Colp12_sorted_trinity150504_noHs@17098
MKLDPFEGVDDFCQKLPKVELHAHLNGSISIPTLQRLLDRRGKGSNLPPYFINDGHHKTIDECFELFRFVHEAVDDAEAVRIATVDVIREFRADNVRYLELRTTPKAMTGLSKVQYIEAVLEGIEIAAKEVPGIITKLLLSIDRKRGVVEAQENVELALKYQTKGVAGVDLSGDPRAGDFHTDFAPVLLKAKGAGLPLALHFAEIPTPESLGLVELGPQRLGHGTCTEKPVWDAMLERRIPLEVCLTSNVKCKTVLAYPDHHFRKLYAANHPICLCTDDKGVFDTTLSKEYAHAARHFSLSKQQLYELSKQAIEYIFADETVKQQLREMWDEHSHTL